MYHHKFCQARETWRHYEGNLISAFREFQDEHLLEIITTAATHALLPLMSGHPPSIRAQIMTARDHYRRCFGRDPRGIWLPECAYAATLRNFCRRRTSAGSSSIRTACCTPGRGRAAAPSRPSTRPTASPPSGATSNPRARSGASMRAIPVTRATAISTATSASISTLTMCGRTCRRPITVGSPA